MKILLIDFFPAEMRSQLEALGQELVYQPDWTPSEILANVADVEVLVMNSKIKADAKLLAAAPQLKMICRAGVGMDHFDLPLLKEAGVLAVNTPGANAIPVAEQAIGMLLNLMHNVTRADQEVRNFKWLREQNRGTEIAGKTVGIIGFGHTGSNFGKMLAGFDCEVIAYDKYKSGFGTANVQEVELDEIFARADILSLHIPLTDETKAWVNEAFFNRFEKPIWFLNLSRGPIVPLADLASVISKGKVFAAGLDVLENEKFATLNADQQTVLEKLFSDSRLLFTPHIGGWSHESLKRINNQLVKEIVSYIQAKP